MPRRKKKSPFPIYLAIGGGLLLIAIAIFLVNQNTATNPLTASSNEEVQVATIERVTVKDAKDALDAGTAIFVDVRAADVYAVSHIPGALSIPLEDVEARLSELNPDQWIITYCT
jgi:3-mercaptopyruvate sulfurtransferase SseA